MLMVVIDQTTPEQKSRKKIPVQRHISGIEHKSRRKEEQKTKERNGGDAKKRAAKAELKRRQREEHETKRQTELGYCDNVWLAKAESAVKIELVTEDNPLFVVNSYKAMSRSYSRPIKTSNGQNLTQKIQIGQRPGRKKQFGVLKQSHQEFLYFLVHLWQKGGCKLVNVDGHPRAVLNTTYYQLALAVCGNTSSKSYDYVRSALEDLESIPIYIENAFTREGIAHVTFIILNAEVRKEVQNTTRSLSQITILFSSVITESFIHGHVKTLSLETYMELDNNKRNRLSSTKLLHRILDRELATKNRYNVALVPLFERLGMSAYKHKSQRKQKIQPTIDCLNKSLILADTHKVSVTLRLSRDGKDFVLVAIKCSIAEFLYSVCDRELATKNAYSRALIPLFEEMRIGPYEDKERRKQKIKSTIKILNKSLILGGTHKVNVELKPSENGEDYVLVAVKSPIEPSEQPADKTLPQVKRPVLAVPASSELPLDYPEYPA